MEKHTLMKNIVDRVGREKAIELVMEAYNTELITTWLSRLEATKPMGARKTTDHLADALERVGTVCDLTR